MTKGKAAILQNMRDTIFKNHTVTFTEHGDGQVLLWSNENLLLHRVRFVFFPPSLFVDGDFGSAVFQFTSLRDIRGLRDIDTTYLESKCVASSHGRMFSEWSKDAAIADLQKVFKLNCEGPPTAAQADAIGGILSAVSHMQFDSVSVFYDTLHRNEGDMEIAFGRDWTEAVEGCGLRTSDALRSIWAALELALGAFYVSEGR